MRSVSNTFLSQISALFDTKFFRQLGDGLQLRDPGEKERLKLAIGDSYIDPKGNRIHIETQEQLDKANSYLTQPGKGIFVFKAKTDNPLDSKQTVYYQDNHGIDILKDGGNYTTSQDDDANNIRYSKEARAQLAHDMHDDGNEAQQQQVSRSLAKLNKNEPDAVTLDEAEKTLLQYSEAGSIITSKWLLDQQAVLLAKEKDGTITPEEKTKLSAVSRVLFDPNAAAGIDRAGTGFLNGTLSTEDLKADYYNRNGENLDI